MRLASQQFDNVLQQLRSLRLELSASNETADATKVSRLIAEIEGEFTEAERRESLFLPFDQYQSQFRSKHIQPFIDACPAAAGAVEDELLAWLADVSPSAKKTSELEDELTDSMEALTQAVEDCEARAAINAAKVVVPMARRLESRRLKAGLYVAIAAAAGPEMELGERIIKAAFPIVTGRTIKLRDDAGKGGVGGYVRVDTDFQESPAWHSVCDAIQAASELSNVLAAIFNSSLTLASRWGAARIRLYVDGELRAYETSAFPWCLELLDARNPNGPLKIFILKSTQVGVSTALFVKVLHAVDYLGKNAIYYMPDEAATKKLGIRLTNLIEASPYLGSRVVQTAEAKRVGFATLHLEGSRGFSAGRSQDSEILVMDEYDLFDPANAQEIARRLTGSKHGLQICASTPRYPSCGIDGLVERHNSQRENFVFDCPFCFEPIRLTFPEAFERHGEFENDPKCDASYVRCPKCEQELDAETKALMMRGGRWELVDPASERREGVRVLADLNHLYSNTVTPGDFSRDSLRTGEAAQREFNNSNLGKPYVELRGQITLATLLNSVSPLYSMGQPVLPKSINPNESMRLLLVDQGRPASVCVCEYRVGKREDHHSSPLDRYVCRVLWAEKASEKQRLDEIAALWGTWACICDADPDDTLPGFLIHNPSRHLHQWGYVVAVRALDVWNTPTGVVFPGVTPGDPLPRLSLCNCHRTQYYAAAIRRANAGNLKLPADISDQFVSECQQMILTHVPDPTGSPRLYAKAIESRAHDYLSCLQLGEVGLELVTTNRIGLVVARPETFKL